mmetsp:Transcript_32120/g.44533  ORF Transcript_32120/g.44533 Transcript_32120/m.44533 type:complete len:381 (-) Transcript_32120:152-1294(-)|eukprot:CAMPEP_0196590050 /NCGR_PEP_ID=MMETSP1081-20130531/65371_1 /TAXON_ID=36882 /ORGANISM="Pyramimonas amylifera, Strain CCMP720" /LENGTH=380 /DNA_ID=CAMNT_0041913027 /DNA_START=207 /DNA_END=1349 /DNA_ORIENTATION=+
MLASNSGVNARTILRTMSDHCSFTQSFGAAVTNPFLIATSIVSGEFVQSQGVREFASRPARTVPTLGHIRRTRAMPNFSPDYWKEQKASKPDRLLDVIPALAPRPWTDSSKRTGLIAVKVGMTSTWDEFGARLPLSVLWVDSCQVLQIKTEQNEGFNSMQLGMGSKKLKQVSSALAGHMTARGGLGEEDLKRKLREFRVSADAVLPEGTEVRASHFAAGQYVDVQGTTIGKGFAGVMKRHGFKGGPASHGSSGFHRGAGSTGQCQDPGKTFKGKKMAGHMGNKTRTVPCAWVYKIDASRNLIYVKGQVPGHAGNFVYVKDSIRKPPDPETVPFPTAILAEGQSWEDSEVITAITPRTSIKQKAAIEKDAKAKAKAKAKKK